MTADDYLKAILGREEVARGPGGGLGAATARLEEICRQWAGREKLDFSLSGALQKGTANMSGRRLDVLAALPPDSPRPLAEAYADLCGLLERLGLVPERRAVSVGVRIERIGLDIIPARRESLRSDAYMLYAPRLGRTIKTSPILHAGEIGASGLVDEIRVIKLWRDQRGLPFPSLYLELSVLAALRRRSGGLAENVWAVLVYLERDLQARAMLDPANANNVVSDLLGPSEKAQVAASARRSIADGDWHDIVA